MTPHLDAAQSDSVFDLPAAGREVSRILLDYRFTLQFLDAGTNLDIAIATPFAIEQGGRLIRVDPERPESLSPALVLLRRVVESVTVCGDGRLVLVFEDGQKLTIQPNPDYEAWESTASDGAKLVCLPGGGIAAWGGHD